MQAVAIRSKKLALRSLNGITARCRKIDPINTADTNAIRYPRKETNIVTEVERRIRRKNQTNSHQNTLGLNSTKQSERY